MTASPGDPLAASDAGAPPAVSIVTPTLREAQSLGPLAARVHAAMSGRAYELIVVDDDSRDGTTELCAALRRDGFPVRLIVRADQRDGLSGAVLKGLNAARGQILVVMDADLQHPPERIPALLEPIDRGEALFTLGSRHVAGGGVAETWGWFRRLNSRVATILARPFAGGVRDPLSGFFAMPRDVFTRGEHLAPTGYKIALELIAKCRVGRVVEVSILFGLRERGQSKLSLREQVRYLEHLSRLYDFTYPRAVPALKFVVTVACALAVAAIVLLGLGELGFRPIGLRGTVAYAAGIVPTALFHARYVRAQREFLVRRSPWADFAISSAAELLAVATVSAYLLARLERPHAFEVLVIAFAAATLVRYLMRKELLMDVRGLRFRARP